MARRPSLERRRGRRPWFRICRCGPRRTRSAEQLAAQQQRVVRPFARSRPVAVARADDDASSEQLSRTPAVRESFLTRFLGIRDSDRRAVPAH